MSQNEVLKKQRPSIGRSKISQRDSYKSSTSSNISSLRKNSTSKFGDSKDSQFLANGFGSPSSKNKQGKMTKRTLEAIKLKKKME